ncbi:Centromere-associated protein NUF2 [Trachipleistophora hominis]|uniref:Centromere-associated protein NUF2 n=1 Tax=Trachipleistophora hominis TaxID=72359 RepID=L7JUZ3_TRAHO|nr:Centromere-associated protein NUF2 [Trachipleistophora hominis]
MTKEKDNIYLIPNFQPSEIISYFSEHGIPILQSEITKPSFQNVLRIYSSIIGLIYTNSSISNDADESKFLLILYKRTDMLLRRLGIDFFELKDLLTPSYKRNLNFLSTIYNFCIYRDSKKEYYEKLLLEKEEQESLLNEINVSINMAESKLKSMKDEAQKKEKENAELENKVGQLEDEVKSLCKEQRERANSVEEMKRERDEFYDKLSSLKLVCLNLKQEIKEMKTQVIDDPSKMLSLIEEMQVLIKTEKASIEEFNKKIRHTTELIDKEEEEKTRIQSAIKMAISQKNKTKTANELQNEVTCLEKTIKSLSMAINVSNRRIDHLSKQISHIEGKIEVLKKKDQENAKELSNNLNKLKDNYSKVRTERNDYFERIANNQKEIKEIEYKMVQIMNQHQKDMHVLISKLTELKNAANRYFMGFEDFNREL